MKPVTKDLPNADQPGVLLQSASAIQAFIDTPMRWKVGQKVCVVLWDAFCSVSFY